MRFIVLQSLLGALCLLVSLCGLLKTKMRHQYYILLFFTAFLLAILSFSINMGQSVTIITMIISLFLIVIGEKDHPILNFCLACIGYTLNVALNAAVLLIITNIMKISYGELGEKYYLQFSGLSL